jgi:L-fuculose-phosphate aldolase
MHRCYEKGWLTTRDGNASFRRSDSKFLYITPSGQRKNVLRVEDIIKMTISDNKEIIIPENCKPSGELHMHALIQLNEKNLHKTVSVLHAHPTHIIAAMYAGFNLDEISQDFPEIYRYTRVGPNVPNLPAISKELGDITYKNLHKDGIRIFDIVGQANHGVCAVARDPWSAYEHIERLDHICEIVLKSRVKA